MSQSSPETRFRRNCVVGLVLLAVVAAAVGVATSLGSRSVAPSVTTSKLLPQHTLGVRDPLAIGSRVAFGVSVAAPTPTALRTFSLLAGSPPKIVMWYQQWSEPIYYPPQLPAVRALDATPMITWDPMLNGVGIPLAQIAAGRYDDYIRSSARAVATRQGRIYVRFAHEMNLPGSPYGPDRDGNTPAIFIAAWRHVVTIFRQTGATNVEWVWSPNVDCAGQCPFASFYPGGSWVDWVALDGYNYSSIANEPWMTFTQVFQRSYADLAGLTSKPMMIAETGSANDGGSKAQWITGMGRALTSHFDRVRAIIWFQRDKETDWRINSSAGALAAFRALVKSPRFDVSTT